MENKNSEKIFLKRATLEDLETVFEFEKNTASKTYFGLKKKDEIKNYIKKCEVFLIKKGKSIVGLISYENKRSKEVGFNGLIVKPKYRCQGIGVRAMKMILGSLKDKKRIYLRVHPHNSSAIQVYLSLGFIIESWKNNYFGDGEPRLTMVYKNKD